MRDYKVLTLRYIVQPQQSDSKGLITRKHGYQYFLHIRSLKDAGTRENQSHWSHSETTIPHTLFFTLEMHFMSLHLSSCF